MRIVISNDKFRQESRPENMFWAERSERQCKKLKVHLNSSLRETRFERSMKGLKHTANLLLFHQQNFCHCNIIMLDGTTMRSKRGKIRKYLYIATGLRRLLNNETCMHVAMFNIDDKRLCWFVSD